MVRIKYNAGYFCQFFIFQNSNIQDSQFQLDSFFTSITYRTRRITNIVVHETNICEWCVNEAQNWSSQTE